MSRTLWQMTDPQIYQLREKSHQLLTELYVDYVGWQGQLQHAEEMIGVTKPKSSIRKDALELKRQADHRILVLEQKIAAQRSFCRSVDEEWQYRNPPFWSHADLDAMDSRRRHS